jgi:hypothetical protein
MSMSWEGGGEEESLPSGISSVAGRRSRFEARAGFETRTARTNKKKKRGKKKNKGEARASNGF